MELVRQGAEGTQSKTLHLVPCASYRKIQGSAYLRMNTKTLHHGYDLRGIVVLHSYHVEAAVRAQEVLHGERNVANSYRL